MSAPSAGSSTRLWIGFALSTVLFWGVYGVLLHQGQVKLADPEHGLYKAFLWVGVAYTVVAVIAPLILLRVSGASRSMPPRGIRLSMVAGSLGALGALGILMAFGAGGHPAVVMSIVFAGAPIVNAVTVMKLHPPPGGLRSVDGRFAAGILIAAAGATLVTWFKPSAIDKSAELGSQWILFAFMTVVCFGLYGVFLHSGQMAMKDPRHGRYKAFLWVGMAYVLIAVLAPVGLLLAGGADWSMPAAGIGWSLGGGVLGAAGAFGVLLAFGARGHPAVVMSIVFAGAPIINAVTAMAVHPPAGGLSELDARFLAGILIAAVGATLVTLFKPAPGPAPSAASPESAR